MAGQSDSKIMNVLKGASLCEGLASCVFISFLPLHVRTMLGESSYLVVSLILALPAFLLFFANNFWGAFVDSTGGFRLAEITGLLGYAACLVVLCAVRNSWGAIAAVAGFSILYGAVKPTLISHATLIREKARAGAISAVLLAQSVGWFLLGLLYGPVYDMGAEWTAWAVMGFPALLGFFMAFLLPRLISDPDLGNSAVPFGRVLKQGPAKVLLGDLREIYGNKRLFRLCLVVLVVSSANWCFFGFFSLIYTEEMGGTVHMLGWTVSMSTVTAIAVFTPLGRFLDRRGGRIGLFVSIFCYIGTYTAVSFLKDPWVVSAFFIIPIYPVFLVSANALAADATRTEQRAGGIGVMNGVLAMAVVAGTLVGGAVGDLYGLRAVVRTAALLSCVGLLSFLLLLSREGNGGGKA